MKPLTVKELCKICESLVEKGYGNKMIMISQDDEGNGYHYLWYAFTTPDEALLSRNEVNENVAKYEDTILLG